MSPKLRRFSGGTGGTGGTPRASGDSGVTEGVTGWYRGAAGAARQYRSVPPWDVSFPRSTACTACTAKGESEQASYFKPLAAEVRGRDVVVLHRDLIACKGSSRRVADDRRAPAAGPPPLPELLPIRCAWHRREPLVCSCPSAEAQARDDHRDALAVLDVARPGNRDEVALFELDRDQDVGRGHHRNRGPRLFLSVAARLQPFSPTELASFPLTRTRLVLSNVSGDAAQGAIVSFKISAVGPEGHTMMSRNTASEALGKAIELVAAGFSNVRIADRTGRLHAPEAFDRFFVKRAEAKGVRTQLQMT